ncbi:Hydrogenase expression/formation protein HoxV (plasmid) [Cupriavidus necator H16]|uniref:Hydrogenase expression/formation protein HoxV n=2 Tax=Cupriavidus necator (strain ATCC 17699 / DSM 428 / KCTC 22496 / NCIMB 10442 / H16 / Stanier 337) TaxID=381666 RepID=HOXV_CUPNH|nr:hydrogenase expression/formation protein HoxV [Cupriavidus necator]P31914.1 RecName: Full=Hydrogenase expression/formation protein HoxV [Cupriavidus necator H16]AAA16471.1 hoxV [Cupriavidus necator H16]AAP85767.1 HoxV [Cupriavidus necator H16]QCC05299.1 hydrogenase expression/formation protein HoxV [Cupriavidus necator H16]QQB81470.1 hydrogenase expression/formation protein HoxV [Cupriavidus necator]
MTRAVALTGRLTFRPGQVPGIAGERPQLAERLLRGRPGEAAPHLLPRLFALCGEAHGVTAALAVNAALGRVAAPEPALFRRLAHETACEHIRRIWLDWPLHLASGPVPSTFNSRVPQRELIDCPMLKASHSESAAMLAWLERAVLGTAPRRWLAHWHEDPAGCLSTWATKIHTWPAMAMRQCMQVAQAMASMPAPLLPHASTDALRELAQSLAGEADFPCRPSWQGRVFETGSWTRLGLADCSAFGNMWLRLGARIAELVLLSLRDGMQASGEAHDSPCLQMGALALAPGQALAWSEMARGLLMHWVRLVDTPQGPVIGGYRIIAPTEWNFHPDGAVAHMLAHLAPFDAADVRRSIGILVAAYDPCVPYTVEFAESLGDTVHA